MNDVSDNSKKKVKRKNWIGRFLEKLAKANSEALKSGCAS